MIGFAGLSHLGIVSGICLASKGFDVVGFDPDAGLAANLASGKLPIHEPELGSLLEKFKNRVTFTSDAARLKECDIVYVSLDVKTDDRNRSDLEPLRELISRVSEQMSADATMVVLSQVPPGFCRKLAPSIKPRLYYQVETLIFGNAVERARRPERYIIGCEDPKKPLPAAFSKVLAAGDCPILPMRFESAELAKISINMCLVSSISVANTLAEICEKIGAEWGEIVPALKSDKRIGPYAYLSPGLGIAGGNLERDLATVCSLATEHGTDAQVVESWLRNSKHRSGWALQILRSEVLRSLSEPKLAVWGLAYKQDTKSTKNSPALALLAELAGFSVRAYDPQVELPRAQLKEGLAQASDELDAARGAHALIVMTPWKKFASIDLKRLRDIMVGRTILDPYGILDSSACIELGFRYFRLGSPVSGASMDGDL